MKKIGMCVVVYNNNFGSMLQSYATMKMIEDLNIDYEVIRYKKKYTPLFILKSIPRILNKNIWIDKKRIIKKKMGMMAHKDIKKANNERNKKFDEFRKKYFTKLADFSVGYKELQKTGKKYDAYLVGSDQLWLPSGLATNFYNLKFVADNKLKVSYASSFGVKQIPFYQIKRTREYLNRIEYISTRENSGRDIVKELTGRDVPVVVDPTLLFNEEQWNDILENKRMYKEKYIFAYFLGANQEHRDKVRELAKEKNMKIVTIRHMDEYIEADNTFGDYAPYEVGPEEFVNLIRNAEYICTDSFHGTVFSIINHKKFLVFNRYSDSSKTSKNSRIESLCENFGLQSRRYEQGKNIVDMIDSSINYKEVDEKVENMREKSKSYLKEALKKVRE